MSASTATSAASATERSNLEFAIAKEQQLQLEAASWTTAHNGNNQKDNDKDKDDSSLSRPVQAQEGDIPVINVRDYFETKSDEALEQVATALRVACETVGVFILVGHCVPPALIKDAFHQVQAFHALPLATKQQWLMDQPDFPVNGVGYLPLNHRKLPARDTGNQNETFIIKSHDQCHLLHDNHWPSPHVLPQFQTIIQSYADSMQQLAKQLLPIFARALDLPRDFFDAAFVDNFYRLRMSHYPPRFPSENDNNHGSLFGINPHVDTSFFTILATQQPSPQQDNTKIDSGLTIYHSPRNVWMTVPCTTIAMTTATRHNEDDINNNDVSPLIVNTGELLKQWTNDRFISVRHFANNHSSTCSRYSIPFFFNAHRHFPMECLPTCTDVNNPPKYPTISYATSQGVVQGE